MIKLKVNGQQRQVAVPADVPLLWVLREELRLTGTKFGCGIAACGACTVHLDGEAVRSCSYPVGAAAGHSVTTIEGLMAPTPARTQAAPQGGAAGLGGGPAAGQSSTPQAALQQAWIAEQVPQCGYCQSGMLMSAAALLRAHPRPTDAQIDAAMTNICRCGTYVRVRAAIHRAAALMAPGAPA